MTRAQNKLPGFTLIELLVVIGIIILLISILLPALAAAKQQAYKTRTLAELTELSNECDQYAVLFNGVYPGPAPAGAISGSTTTGTAKISGTQNLLIALTYSMYNSNSLPTNLPSGWNPITLPGGGVVVDAGNASGPTDLSVTPAHSYQPFYTPNGSELSPAVNPKAATLTWPVGGVGGAFSASFPFPTILDRYPDALPILYYRCTPNTTGSIVYGSDFTVGGTQTIVGETASGSPTPYYRSENAEYTDSANLTSLSGTPYPQSGVSGIAGSGGTQDQNLAELIVGESAGNTVYARGGFVLISAGGDRVYGQNLKKNNSSDDIVVVGGGQ